MIYCCLKKFQLDPYFFTECTKKKIFIFTIVFILTTELWKVLQKRAQDLCHCPIDSWQEEYLCSTGELYGEISR